MFIDGLISRAAFIIGVLICAAVPAAAHGHQGLYESSDVTGFEDAIVLKKPDVSYAAYMRLDKPGDVDFISFTVDGPMKIKASLLVPRRPEFADYYPVFAVVGPGLARPASEIPFELPEGYGAEVIISEPSDNRPKFYEPFSGTKYYRGFETFERVVDEPGQYYLAVWSPDGEYGDYTVTYGEKESFSPREMIDTYRVVAKVWSGKWGRFRGSPQPAAKE